MSGPFVATVGGGSGMIVVMKVGSSPQQVEHVVKLVREMGLKDHVIVGTERTVVACIGNDRFKDRSVLESAEGVEKVVPILAPYKMASREVKKERSVVPLILGKAHGATVGHAGLLCFGDGGRDVLDAVAGAARAHLRPRHRMA